MKRSPLRQNGKSETAKCKVRIQALLRELALLRDGGCVLFEVGGTGNIPYCGSAPTKDGHTILQYDHLNSRGFNVSFADIRLGVILCQGHHAWKTFRAKKQYDILIRQIIGPERARALGSGGTRQQVVSNERVGLGEGGDCAQTRIAVT